MNTFNNTGFEKDFKTIQKQNNVYIINFDKNVLGEDAETGEKTVTWKSFVYNPRKNGKSIVDNICDIINEDVTYVIENCFTWNGYSIHLNKENQMNYKAAFDLALSTNGESLPVTFRFYKNRKPELYTFDNVAELKDFYIKANAHINKCLMNGWTKKDSINESDYKI